MKRYIIGVMLLCGLLVSAALAWEWKVSDLTATEDAAGYWILSGVSAVDTNLLMWHKFDADFDVANTIYDSTANDHDGVQANSNMQPVWTNDYFVFDHTDDKINLATNDDFIGSMLTDFSVTAWIRPRYNVNNIMNSVLVFGKRSNAEFVMGYLPTSRVVRAFVFDDDSDYLNVIGSGTLHPDLWQYYAATWDASEHVLSLYLQGALDEDGTSAAIGESTLIEGYIGSRLSGAYPGPYGGGMDDLRVYDKLLSAAEIGIAFTNTRADNLYRSAADWSNWTNHLVAEYRLNGNWHDEVSGSNGTGNAVFTYELATLDASQYGNTYNSSLLNSATQATISIWYNPRAFSLYAGIFSMRDAAGFDGIIQGTSAEVILARVYATGGNVGLSYSGTPIKTWSHLAFTWDGGSGNAWLFVNGELKSSDTNGAATGTFGQTDVFKFGYEDGMGARLNGYLDEAGIWDYAMSTSEVAQLYLDMGGPAR